MKTKNLYSFLAIILTSLSLSSSLAKQKQIKPIPMARTELDRYFNFEKSTPSQMNALSVRSYFQSLTSPFFSLPETRSATKSKTTVFNQSLTKYVKEIYNNKYYPEFLSQNGTHIVEFLELSNELNLEIEPLYTCLRLFYNKIKACELIDDTVILQILKPLPILLEKYFEAEEYEAPAISYFSKNIEKVLFFKFTEHMQDFQEKPNAFIAQLSEEMAQMAKKEIDDMQATLDKKELLERLRQIIIRFFETALSKVIWNQTAYEGIWESVISIANHLQILGVHGILDHMDDLDDLLWTLTYRFGFFLDLAGSSMPVAFYEEIETDLESRVVFFLEAQEQDEGIKTKKEVMLESLMQAKAKALAFEKRGLFTDQLI